MTRSSDSPSESSEAIVDWNTEVDSEPDSPSEGRDGDSLEGKEYEDRSVDGSDFAASLEDFLGDADSSNCGQSTLFYAALDNAQGAQVSALERLQFVPEEMLLLTVVELINVQSCLTLA